MSTIPSPTRRVLGEKDVNASMNKLSPRKDTSTSLQPRNLPSVQLQIKALSASISAVPSSPRIGQKRRIHEVEGPPAEEWDGEVMASQGIDMVSDSASEGGQMDMSMMSARSAADTTMTSFGIGPSQENVVEQQFELLEPEMSQRTLDKIHAVTLPQNTSQPSQLKERPELTQNTSQDSVGMSAFLNLYSDPSSQASDGLRPIEVLGKSVDVQVDQDTRKQPAPVEASEEDKRRALMEEKAAQLRTKLQLALFKVETRQTNTPFSRLKVPKKQRVRSQSPPILPSLHTSSHRQQSHSISIIPKSRAIFNPETLVAARRAEATMQLKPPVRSLNSLPMPQIQPTSFSARFADHSTSVQTHGHSFPLDHNDVSPNIPSSPPVSNHSQYDEEEEAITLPKSGPKAANEIERSPTLPAPKTTAPVCEINAQLSSPPLSQGDGNGGLANSDVESTPSSKSKSTTRHRERRLTSSVVKGEAASGLLQLMRGGMMNGNMRGPMCGL